MKRIIAAAVAAVVLLTAAAPAWAAHYYYIPVFIPGPGVAAVPDPDVGPYTGIKKVAILSSLGTALAARSKALNLPLDISAWKIDQEIAGTIRKYLGGRFEFVDMSFDSAPLNALPTVFMRESKTTDLVKTYTNPGVDAYILVRPRAADSGLELLARDYGVLLLANYEIDVIDAHTGRYISKSVGRAADLPGDKPQFPGAQMPDGFWSGYDREIAPARMALLHKYLTQMMTLSLVETIRSLEFGVPLPPTGDHSIAEPIMADALSGIRSVAVVSAVGNQLQMINPGNMFTTRTDISVPIADWGLDARIEEIMRDALAPRYTVKTMHTNREALSRQVVTGGERLPRFQGLDGTRDVAAYVVVLPAIERGNWPYHGLGMLNITPLMNREADVFADYAIVVIDARNLVSVTGYVAARGETSCAQPERMPVGLPACKIDEKLWPDKDGALGPDAAAQVRKTLDAILTASIPQTLFHLGLNESPSAETQAAAQ